MFNLIASLELPQGRLEGSIHNLSNRRYETRLIQANSRAPFPSAQSRTISLGYTIDW